jgi:hypothetical protein
MVNLVLENDPQGSFVENKILERLYFPRLHFAKIYIRPGQRLLSLPDIWVYELRDLTIDVRAGDSSRGNALADDKLQKRLAKRLMVGFLNMGLKLHCADSVYLFRKCSLV